MELSAECSHHVAGRLAGALLKAGHLGRQFVVQASESEFRTVRSGCCPSAYSLLMWVLELGCDHAVIRVRDRPWFAAGFDTHVGAVASR